MNKCCVCVSLQTAGALCFLSIYIFYFSALLPFVSELCAGVPSDDARRACEMLAGEGSSKWEKHGALNRGGHRRTDTCSM